MTFQTIITVSKLAENLHNDNWFILDCRGGALNNSISYKDYLKGHIPNAHYCCFTEHNQNHTTHSKTKSAISLVEPKSVIANLKTNGINETSQIVLYDVTNSTLTDSLWLLLRSSGYKNIAVLQGGFEAWERQDKKNVFKATKSFNKCNSFAAVH